MSDTAAMTESAFYIRTTPAASLPPPRSTSGPWAWARENLFSGIGNTVLTVLSLLFLAWTVPGIVNFLLIDAVWSGVDREACLAREGAGVGACWAFVRDRFEYFVYGSYPRGEVWRVNLVFLMGAAGMVWLLVPSLPRKGLGSLFFFAIFPVLAYGLLTGGNPFRWYGSTTGLSLFVLATLLAGGSALLTGRLDQARQIGLYAAAGLAGSFLLGMLWSGFSLQEVETNLWGGILVTMVVAVVGIVVSLPIGILLALGRRSKLPAIKFVSVVFIEFVRGVPLITVLFMASVMLPLFLPAGMQPDKLLRALVGVALFASAYMAEVVRAGLQALPKGQYEGAMAMGLGYWQMMRLIILPQALKVTLPNIVNTYIGLFKDTTLVFIVGLFDFLRAIDAALVDPAWATPVTRSSGYAFAGLFYFACCYGMSRYAASLERKLGKGDRR